MIRPEELDALEAAAHGVLGVACVVIEPGYVAPPGPSPAQAAFLEHAPLVLRLVSARRNIEQPSARLLDVWREAEQLRKRVAELEALNAAGAKAVDALERISEQARHRIMSLAGWGRYALAHWAPEGSVKADRLRQELDEAETETTGLTLTAQYQLFTALRDELLAADICLACGRTPGRRCQCENDE